VVLFSTEVVLLLVELLRLPELPVLLPLLAGLSCSVVNQATDAPLCCRFVNCGTRHCCKTAAPVQLPSSRPLKSRPLCPRSEALVACRRPLADGSNTLRIMLAE
jgi:hypothetical protein